MISKAEIGRAATLLVALILAGMFLAGCVADTPNTYLDWGPVRETALPSHPASVAPRDAIATRELDLRVSAPAPGDRGRSDSP